MKKCTFEKWKCVTNANVNIKKVQNRNNKLNKLEIKKMQIKYEKVCKLESKKDVNEKWKRVHIEDEKGCKWRVQLENENGYKLKMKKITN